MKLCNCNKIVAFKNIISYLIYRIDNFYIKKKFYSISFTLIHKSIIHIKISKQKQNQK